MADTRSTRKIDGEAVHGTDAVLEARDRLRRIGRELDQVQRGNEHWHRVVTLRTETLSRLLHLDRLYQSILDVPGIVCEFGVHWGATFSTLLNLRAIYEPFNVSRVVVGFDTFDGFPGVSPSDGSSWDVGDFRSTAAYENLLHEIAEIHESLAPRPEVKKFELVKGDVRETLDPWLKANPHSVIALAILDLDLYEPTRHVLERILPRCTAGTVLVFDEFAHPEFPGETQAVMDEMGLGRLRLQRSRYATFPAFAVLGDR